jgi:MoaA/NifB/PqqE/SkfB family radical SAM enzyme
MDKNMLGLTYEAFKSNITHLNKPYKLNFAITMKCQSRCLTCNIWQLKPENELTLEEIGKFAQKNNFFRWIGITGGEPFLRNDIVEIVRAFKENSKGLFLLTIPTNSLCREEKILESVREMAKMKIPKIVITVSLDGHKEMHDKIRGVPGNYEKAISVFRALKKVSKEYRNISTVFGYTISGMNNGNFMENYKKLKVDVPDLEFNDFHINLAQTSSNYYRNEGNTMDFNREAVLKDLNDAYSGRSLSLNPMELVEASFLKNLIKFVETSKAPIKCRSLDSSLFLDNWGNVYPSIMWDYKITNIREIDYDLSKAWNNEKALEARRIIRNGNDPQHWTSCEAYQSILGSAYKIFG